MFSYLKQVVDSVESQLDSILDAQNQPTAVNGDTPSAATAATTDSQSQVVSAATNVDIGSKIASKFEKLKEQTKTSKIESSIPNSPKPVEITTITASDSAHDLHKMKEFKMEPMKVPQLAPVPKQSLIKEAENTSVEKVVTSSDQIPQSMNPSIAAQSAVDGSENQGWGDGWNEDLDIPEDETTVIHPTVVGESAIIENVPTVDEGSLSVEHNPGLSLDQQLVEQVNTNFAAEQHTTELSPQSPSLDLLEQLKHREEQLVRSKVDNAELHQQVEQATSDLIQLQELLDQERMKSNQLHKEVQGLRFDYDRLKGESVTTGGNSDKRVLELTRALSEKEQSIVGLLQEGEKLAKEILKGNNTIKKYKKDLEIARKDIAEKDVQNEESQTKINQLTTKLNTLQDAERYLQEQVKQLMDNKVQLTKKVTDLEMNIVKASQETIDLKGFIASLETEIAKMKDEREKENLEAQSAALEEQLSINANLSSQLTSALKITTDLQSTISKLVLETHVDRRITIDHC
jgi:hypothetical protein